MHVLFVTECRFDKTALGDGSTRYRCFNVAEALIAGGYRATVASLSELAMSSLGRYDVISVLRPRASYRLASLIKNAKANCIHLVADFDDLIFDPGAAANSPLVINGFATVEQVRRKFKRYAKACSWFDEITVSTRPLAAAAKQCFPSASVYVLANGLSPLWLHHADSVMSLKKCRSDHSATLSYLPGTRSHDADFAAIKTAVSTWLSSNPDKKFRIVGELDIDEGDFRSDQLIKEPLVPFFQLPEIVADSKVTLAPLVNSVFNNAKSHIKFLESAAFGVPVVATSIDDIKQHSTVAGLFCLSTGKQWHAAIDAAVKASYDPEVCAQLSAYVRKCWVSTQTSRQAIQRWCDIAGKSFEVKYVPDAECQSINPDTFYSSLRPVPHFYSRNGWQPARATQLVVFESAANHEFMQLDLELLEKQVKSTGREDDQWLVLVSRHTPPKVRDAWHRILLSWRPQALHLEVLHAATFSDRCSIVYQSDGTIWMTAELHEGAVSNRTLTLRETIWFSVDRWMRKVRKFRESPTRFFADSKIVRLAGR